MPNRDETLRPLLGGVLSLAAAMGIGRFAFTPILPAMERAGQLGTTQAGLLAAVNYAGYLVGALVVAVVPRSAQTAVLRAALVAVVATTALMAATTGLVVWSVVRFAAGAASAGVFVLTARLVLDELRRTGRGARSGWLFSGPGLGIVVSGLVVRIAGNAAGWRGDWALLALAAAAAIAPCWRWIPPSRLGGRMAPGAPPAARPMAALALRLLFAAYALEGIGYIVTGTFLPTIVERAPGSRGLGSIVWIVVGVAAIPAGVLWAAIGERCAYARALACAFVLQAGGIALPLLGGVGPAVVSAVLFGGTFIGISALTITLAGRLDPTRSARLIGQLTAAYGVGQMAGTAVAGWAAGGAHGFAPALLGASVLVLVGGAAMAALYRLEPPCLADS